ncbi:MAG: hypothetical protein JRJ47_12825 [Deltaproteobacteria bacterium]|nr:hypothetical protein [Deltaproteobacteria bacterium]
MVTPENIAFDIDGVFANTMGLFLEIARKDFGINNHKYATNMRTSPLIFWKTAWT